MHVVKLIPFDLFQALDREAPNCVIDLIWARQMLLYLFRVLHETETFGGGDFLIGADMRLGHPGI